MIENDHFKIWLRDDDIVELSFKEGCCINKDDAVLIREFLRKKSPPPKPVLFDRTTNYEMSWDIQKMAMEEKNIGSIAIVVHDEIGLSLSSYAKDHYLLNTSVEMFSNRDNAVKWLKGQISS